MGRRVLLAASLFAVILLAALTGAAARPRAAQACAFLRNPHAYEAEQSRATYRAAIDAASINMLFPTDPFFGLPAIERGARSSRVAGAASEPPTLLKAISWVESDMTMAARAVAFQSGGPALVSFDCGHGLMQVTTGMTVPLGDNERPTSAQTAVATHFAYNIARGAAVLAEKWNQAPELRPVAGVDNNSDPNIVENWYYAVWSYNGFTGPGAVQSNHPSDPRFAWPREAYRCDGQQARSRHTYQELVWGCMANPPERNNQLLWAPLRASLPDLSLPQYFEPLGLDRFVFPYASMDMVTPQPATFDAPPAVPPGFVERILGRPILGTDTEQVSISVKGRPEDARATVRIRNDGAGILSWSAIPDERWLIVDPPAGVAISGDFACTQDCAQIGTMTITVNPTLLPQSSAGGTLRISSPNGGGERILRVNVDAEFEFGAPGVSRND